MKKILIIICSIFISSNVYASTIVMDMDNKRVLYEDNIHEEKLIASLTKVMTSIVVINNVDNLNKEIEVNEIILKSIGSNIYLSIGEKIKIIDLLYGLMLRSGNDAALVLAEYVGGSIEGFNILMNETAQAIGMYNTTFINPSGLENEEGQGNTSTAYDMALLMSYAMQNNIFRTITQTKEKTVKTNLKTYNWVNKNKLIHQYKYITGGKTGYTKKAYRTLVTTASKDNKNLVIVTLNESDDFNKHKKLYEEYFNKYNIYKIIDSKTFLKDKNQYIKKDIKALLTKEEYNNINIKVNYTNDSSTIPGNVTITLNDFIIAKEKIYKINIKKKSLIDKIKEFLWKIIT